MSASSAPAMDTPVVMTADQLKDHEKKKSEATQVILPEPVAVALDALQKARNDVFQKEKYKDRFHREIKEVTMALEKRAETGKKVKVGFQPCKVTKRWLDELQVEVDMNGNVII